jgi:hypothetical protein
VRITEQGVLASNVPAAILPLRVRIARSDADLDKVARLRAAAYGRHLPEFGARLRAAEAADRDPQNVVLLAEAKLDGSPLGSMRVHFNHRAPLPLEGSAALPAALTECMLAEAVRLNVSLSGEGRLARDALFKSFYLVCAAQGVHSMVICARRPLDRMYRALAFDDVVPGAAPIEMAHIGGIAHWVLQLAVRQVEPRWRAVSHPLYDYFFRTFHPDLELDLDHAEVLLPMRAAPVHVESQAAAVLF